MKSFVRKIKKVDKKELEKRKELIVLKTEKDKKVSG